MESFAYKQGVTARNSNHPEPPCPYEPGTEKFREFAEGFCANLIELDENLQPRKTHA